MLVLPLASLIATRRALGCDLDREAGERGGGWIVLMVKVKLGPPLLSLVPLLKLCFRGFLLGVERRRVIVVGARGPGDGWALVFSLACCSWGVSDAVDFFPLPSWVSWREAGLNVCSLYVSSNNALMSANILGVGQSSCSNPFSVLSNANLDGNLLLHE